MNKHPYSTSASPLLPMRRNKAQSDPLLSICLLIVTLGMLSTLTGCLSFQTKALKEDTNRYVSVGTRPQKIRYYKRGKSSAPAVILLHGYGSAGSIWRFLTPLLEKSGYRTYALDLPGFGQSDKYKGNYETSHIAKLVVEFMKKKGIKRADLVAHSWGSSVALSVAVQYPRKVRRIIINSGWVFSKQIVPVIRWAKVPVLGELVYGLFFKERPGDKFALSVYDKKKFVNMAVVQHIKKDFKRPGYLAAALAVARGMNFEKQEKQYKTLKHETLLIWGKQDRVSLPFYGRRLESELPNAQLILVNRCGHIPMIERTHQVNRIMLNFLGNASTVPFIPDPYSKQKSSR